MLPETHETKHGVALASVHLDKGIAQIDIHSVQHRPIYLSLYLCLFRALSSDT